MAVTEIGPLSIPVYGRFMKTHTFLSIRPFFTYLRKNIFKNVDCSLWSDNNPASKDIVMFLFFFTADILSCHSRKRRGVIQKNNNDKNN